MLDSTALFGHVCKELSYKRKDALRPMLHPDFKPLCSKTHKVGSLLIGDDLAKTAQDIRSSTKTVMSLTHQLGYNPMRRYPLGASPSSRPFLSQRGRTPFPPRTQYPPRKPQHYPNRKRFTKN